MCTCVSNKINPSFNPFSYKCETYNTFKVTSVLTISCVYVYFDGNRNLNVYMTRIINNPKMHIANMTKF